MFKKMFLLIFFMLNQIVFGVVRVDPLVSTKLGLIRGVMATDGDYAMFMGIPYAKVDEANPFGDAIPQTSFDDTFDATDDSAICPQIEEYENTVTGSLDCLHLNVYSPNSANFRNPLPVLVFIYGGAFSRGFAGRYLYGPKYLVRHDIILVTINYRLGPYGFMCLDIPEIPGNQGLKDQLLAFKWIKDNIAAFGGDPNKITISGRSAGAMSVDFHLMSTHEKLFNNVIIQSGTSLTPTFYEPRRDAPLILAAYLGYETNNLNDALSFLAATDTNSVISATDDLDIIFKPCVEQTFDDVDSFLSENWINADVPKVKNVPVLLGFNEHETLYSYASRNEDYFRGLNIFEDKLSIGFDVDNDAFVDMEELVRHFYIGDEDISEETKWGIINFDSDFKFNHPTYRTIHKYIENGAGNIYLYLFSYVGTRNYVRQRQNITIGGATHGDEIGYLFDISYFDKNLTLEDELVVERMTTMWANFVKYSNPTPELTDLLNVKWTPITKGSDYYNIEINSELSASTRPFSTNMAFWDVFYKLNTNLQRVYPGQNVV